ncbi:MAG: hypothetical protein ACON4U_10155 [Myxococcota bacterium]
MSGLVLTLVVLGFACSSETPSQEASNITIQATQDLAILEKSWPLVYATTDSRSDFEGNPGWMAYFNRDYATALTSLSGDAQARVHIELASLYRQALRLHAHSTVHLFESNAQETDPVEARYLLGVSKLFLGEQDAASALLLEPKDSFGPFAPNADIWRQALDESQLMSIKADTFPIAWTEITPGGQLSSESVPHHQLPLNGDSGSTMSVTDGTTLWLRSIWHEQAAQLAAPESGTAISAALNPFRLPFETHQAIELGESLPVDWLFLSYYMSDADVHFLSAIQQDGLAAVAAHAPHSLYSSILTSAIVDQKVSVEQSVVLASRLKEQLLNAIEEKNGSLDPVHTIFAEFAEIGLLHSAMVLADVNDQYRDAGEIRLNMRDLVQKSPKNPLFFLELAAWDAGNKSPLRPQEILHRFSSDYPALEVARAPLDSLHIRISRGSGPGPLH